MARPLWFVALLKKTFPNTRIIAKLTNVPIIGGIIERMLFEGDDIIYLPKDSAAHKTITIGKSLERPTDTVLPSQIVDEFIKKANYHWIMNFCICRDSLQCKDYPIDYGCLFLGEATLGINPNLGRKVTKEEALEYVKKVREAGLVHLIGRNKLDSVWLNVGPGEKLLTICNCCPCCCLWRMLPDITPHIGEKVTKMPGVEIRVNDSCIGCGKCTQNVCFVDAIHIVKGRAVIGKNCRACGRCVEVCPNDAIEIHIDRAGYDIALERIAKVVDVE
ncbi:MAG: Electron transport complex subunit RsxB [Candidatus Thorarchaeota archaeon]|nr:MAG: Electron transport complex subunit RsxB [Candidatus Thorarchaeota archaeon]